MKQELLLSLLDHGKMLLKLKLSKTSLVDVVDHLCNFLSYSQILSTIDLSWTGLTPRHMVKVSESIQSNDNIQQLRSLSFANNTLTFEQAETVQPQLEIYSYSFLTSFVELTQKARNLNHLDISGMAWALEPLIKLSHALVTCPNLASVHMCDNGLYGNLESKLTVLDIFGISQE